MSLSFESLVQIALLGTEHQVPARLAGETTPLGQLQQLAQSEDREQTLLSLAAITGIHHRIGALPRSETRPLAAASASESKQRSSDRASGMLAQILSGRFADLLPEWLRIAYQTNQIVAPEILPSLLPLGVAATEMRELIMGVIGERGLWLAQRNPDWAWVCGACATAQDLSLWEASVPQVRVELLRRLRASDPTRARELLAATWKDESPDDRAAFLDAFSIQLSAPDEEFLEQALADRRKEVRKGATKLLARLSQSKFAARMIERADQLVQFIPAEEGGLLKFKRSKQALIEVNLPDQLETSWQRDGIEAKPPRGIGEKAWWIIQLLEVTPLVHWTEKWNVSPTETILAAIASEWKSELVEGWLRAALLQRNSEWAEALFPVATSLDKKDRLGNLLELMTSASVESSLSPLLAAKTPEAPLVFLTLHDWSPDFSREVLTWLRAITAQESYDWQTRNRIPELAARLAPETLSEAKAGWRSPVAKGSDFWRTHVEEFIAAAEFRREMIDALRNPD